MQLWKREPQIADLAPALSRWFGTDLGRAVLAAEQGLIGGGLAGCFGYHLLQLGVDNNLTLFADARVQRCFRAGPTAPTTGAGNCAFVQCDYAELPFETDSLDVVIVHHVLEFAANPHAVLRELYRVTVPHGRILLVGFNPWSLFGAHMLVGHWRRNSVWRNHALAAWRTHDWLQVLGFETERTDFAFFRPPFNRTAGTGAATGGWTRRLPFGGVYMITAVKQTSTFIPIKPRWARPAVLSALPVAKPSATIEAPPLPRRHGGQ